MQISGAGLILIGLILFNYAWRFGKKARAESEVEDVEEEVLVSIYDLPRARNSDVSGTFLGLALIAWMLGFLFLFI